MKKTLLLTTITVSSIITIFLLLIGSAVFFIRSVIEEKIGEPVTHYQAVEAVLNLNMDSELEKEAKSERTAMTYENVSVYLEEGDEDLFP